MLASALARVGYEVVTAADGERAVTLFEERYRDFALVLLDVTMPRVDGRVALRQMRRIDPTVSVILMSGYSEGEVEHDSSVRFLQKPFAGAQLLSCIDQVLSKT